MTNPQQLIACLCFISLTLCGCVHQHVCLNGHVSVCAFLLCVCLGAWAVQNGCKLHATRLLHCMAWWQVEQKWCTENMPHTLLAAEVLLFNSFCTRCQAPSSDSSPGQMMVKRGTLHGESHGGVWVQPQ